MFAGKLMRAIRKHRAAGKFEKRRRLSGSHLEGVDDGDDIVALNDVDYIRRSAVSNVRKSWMRLDSQSYQSPRYTEAVGWHAAQALKAQEKAHAEMLSTRLAMMQVQLVEHQDARLAAEELGLRTSPYEFAATREEYLAAIDKIGMPCVVKPIMSSSGKGQSTVKTEADIESAWQYAQEGGRAGAGKVIVEGFVDFDYEITQLTVRHVGGTSFCDPIGHVQVDGDYRESWQPQPMTDTALANARDYA